MILLALFILIIICYLFAFTLARTARNGDELNARVGLNK